MCIYQRQVDSHITATVFIQKKPHANTRTHTQGSRHAISTSALRSENKRPCLELL